MKASSTNPVSLLPIYLVNFIGALGFSIVLPFLVALVTRLGGNALVYGAIGATYSAFQLVGAPILGRWSDVHGRRKILLLTAEPRIAIYIGGLLFSLGNGLMWPSFLAILSKTGEPKYQGSIQGLGSSVGSFASIVGLILGGVLYESIRDTTFLLSGVLLFLVFLMSLRLKRRNTK